VAPSRPTLSAVIAAFVLSAAAASAQPLPTYVTLPPSLKVVADSTTAESFGEFDFRVPGKDVNVQRGRHWRVGFKMDGVPEDAAGKTVWARIKPALLAGGWIIAGEYDENPFSATARPQRGRDAWACVNVSGRDDVTEALVEVQGHTDAIGNDTYNQALSQARSQTVMAWLTAHGIPASQLTAKGYGKATPVASNDTDAGRAQNRRVELACRK